MITNHLDIVQQEHAKNPPNWSATPDGILAFVVRVCNALPPEEQWGLHEKPGGENIAYYAPADKMVGISRVMHPDGQLYKILTDAGVGGANGPAWNEDDIIDTDRYVAVTDSPNPPEPPDPPQDDLEARMDALEAENIRQQQLILAQEGQIRSLSERLDAVENAPAPTFDASQYYVEGNTSRTAFHAHTFKSDLKAK